MRQARLAYRDLAGLFVAGAVVQFFLAGPRSFGARSFGDVYDQYKGPEAVK